MNNLPLEILEDILSRLDYFTLTKMKTVSKRWHELTERVIRRTYMYYEKCLKEIPKKYWIAIMECLAHPDIRLDAVDEMSGHSELWQLMYESWVRWNTLLDKKPKIRSIDVPMRNITALDVSGNIVAIGSVSSPGHIYDIARLSDEPIYEMLSPVHDIWIWRKGNDIRALTLAETINSTTLITQWDVTAKRRIEHTEYHGPILVSTCLDYRYTFVPRRLDEEEYELNPESDSAYTLEIKRLGPGTESKTIKIPYIGYISFVEADGDRILMSSPHDYSESTLTIYASSSKYDIKAVHTFPWNHYESGIVDMHKSGVLSTVEQQGMRIGFSVDNREWKFYGVDADLKLSSEITQIFHHVGILILGFESGEICIIHVKDQLDSLNLEIMRSTIVKVSSQCITCLNVTDYNSKSYIIATSISQLYIIEFNDNLEISQSQNTKIIVR